MFDINHPVHKPNNLKNVRELAEYYQDIEDRYSLAPGSFFLHTKDHSVPAHFPHNLFNFFYAQKINGKLFFAAPDPKFKELNDRRRNMVELIKQAAAAHDIADFPCTIIGYDDKSVAAYMYDEVDDTKCIKITKLTAQGHQEHDTIRFYHPEAHIHTNLIKDFSSRDIFFPVLSTSTFRNLWSETIPDFIYIGWDELGLNYEQITNWLLDLNSPALTDQLGWRGSDNSPREFNIRQKLVDIGKTHDFDIKFIRNTSSEIENFVSIKDMVLNWRYLIDVPGFGYSGRVKILLHAPRVLFISQREFKEDFYQYLEPWKHYVPVAENLSDLLENLDKIKSNPDLEQEIIYNAQTFARTHLTKSSALKRIAERLDEIGKIC